MPHWLQAVRLRESTMNAVLTASLLCGMLIPFATLLTVYLLG
jgi:hypothetical protein